MSLIEVSGKSITKTSSLASKIYLHLRDFNTSKQIEILRPAPALIFKLKNLYRYHIIIKSLKQDGSSDRISLKTESIFKEMQKFICLNKPVSDQRVSIEVDPMDFY
jgi:primosomal protein N'